MRKMKLIHEDSGEDRSRSTRSSRKSGLKGDKDGNKSDAHAADKNKDKNNKH